MSTGIMTSPLSERLKDPVALLSACQVALPSWSCATLNNFTSTVLKQDIASPGVYLVTCNLPGAKPARAVVKLDMESTSLFYSFYKVHPSEW